MKRLTALLAVFLLHACASQPEKPLSASERCQQDLYEFIRVTEKAGVKDAQYPVISTHPHLAANRFLAHLSRQSLSADQRNEWLQRAYQLALTKRHIEFRNLPANSGTSTLQQLDNCAQLLLANDLKAAQSAPLPLNPQIPDNYSLLKRSLGLYPLTRYFVSRGVDKWHKEAKAQFPAFNDKTALVWQPQNQQTLSSQQVQKILSDSRQRSSLGIPSPNTGETRELLAHFAPDWSIEQASAADHPGAIDIEKGTVIIDKQNPVIYTYLSHTLWHDGQILLQLNYTIWFPERAKQSAFDIYAGFLDGLIWRVTLDTNGSPLFYDSIHPCGCYYQVFAAQDDLSALPTPSGQEPILELPLPETLQADKSLTIHIQAGDHYIKGISKSSHKLQAKRYRMSAYDKLRSLHTQNGIQSLFSPDGLVKGSERFERWFLWPAGVSSPGAMRQTGNHAIAFVGRRHFDDPQLFVSNFTQTTGNIKKGGALSK
jgi:hypothetical protein